MEITTSRSMPLSRKAVIQPTVRLIKYLIRYVVLKKRKISASAQNLISKMLVKDASKRLTAAEVLAHPWFQENKCKHDDDADFAISTEVLD